ncbi:MAG: MFS transporter, partial [Saprospiraceae bacterium]|nr:MFS transporter [Saprospiraceae bacterium]
MIEKGNKKIIRAWTFYDWAVSVYALVITTAIFPTFYEKVTTRVLQDGTTTDIVSYFGYTFNNTELFSYVVAASFLVVSVLSPVLSGVADYLGNKKFFLRLFCYVGALSCGTLYFFDPDHLEWSMFSLLFASIGYWGSIVFYNAYLPEIAHPKDHDRISAQGFSLGYLGASILLIIILILIMAYGMNARWAFVMVMVWWLTFAQYTFAKLPAYVRVRRRSEHLLLNGLRELQKVWREVRNMKIIRRYLSAFFVYSMGVQTVMVMAVLFAAKEVDWGSDSESKTGLIISVLIIQFIAILGASVFSRMSARIGNIAVLKIAVIIWATVCAFAYFITTPLEFYFVAATVGFVMGGIQALSRSTYSKMLPETLDHASYFSFYDVLEKIAIVIGTFSFGF